MLNKRGMLPSLILLGGVFLSSWVAIKTMVFEVGDHDPNRISGVGTGVTNWKMAENGKLQSILKTQVLTHYADGHSILSKVQGSYFDVKNPQLPPWELSGEKGSSTQGGQFLTIEQNVELKRKASDQDPAMEAKTNALYYDRAKHQIYTDQWVTLTEPELGNQTTGEGMKINLNTNQAKLLNHVHTLYFPQGKTSS